MQEILWHLVAGVHAAEGPQSKHKVEESPHPYPRLEASGDRTLKRKVHLAGAASLEVRFDPRCETAPHLDWLALYTEAELNPNPEP